MTPIITPFDSIAPASRETVCVTGAGGFITSWLVKLLLERGYNLKGTVRNPDDPRNDHLKMLKGATERLALYKADLLDYDSLKTAIAGCHGVFHTASPVADVPEVTEPALKGTRNVIMAAAEALVDESCWSDLDFLQNTKNHYCYGKTAAEMTACEVAAEKVVDLVVVCPAVVLGPLLQSSVNAGTIHILKYLTGTCVSRACFTEGRSGILAKLLPRYPVPTKCSDKISSTVVEKPYKFSNQKLKDLGIQFIAAKRCIVDSVKSLQEKGHLPILQMQRIIT